MSESTVIQEGNFIQQEAPMPGKIINHVPRLLKERNLKASDLLYGARVAPGTAYSISDENKTQTGITYDVLARLCDFFGVSIGEILEYIPEDE